MLGRWVMIIVLLAGWAQADTISFDFSAGLGPDFTVIKNRDFWSVTTDSSGLRVSKPGDDGSTFTDIPSPLPPPTSEFTNGHDTVGGVASNFVIDGDFSVTVDYTWNFIETPAFGGGDNGLAMWLGPDNDLGFRIQIKSYRLWDGRQSTNMNHNGTSSPELGSTPLSGQFRFVRVGGVLSGYATGSGGSLTFITSFSSSVVQGPLEIRLVGVQNQNTSSGNFNQIDPRGRLDGSFNGLLVEADTIKGLGGAAPEPATLLLVLVGLVAVARLRFRCSRC